MSRVRYGASLDERLRNIGWTVDERGCWNWLGSIQNRGDGYGTLQINGSSTKAHRISYTAWVGPIPDGLFVLHSCDNKRCINPDHLRVGTQADNMRDVSERGNREWHGGDRHPRNIFRGYERALMAAQYMLGGISRGSLAKEYRVSRSTVDRSLQRVFDPHNAGRSMEQKEAEAEANLRATEVSAQAQVVEAQAEADANALRAASLTPELIEANRVEALKIAAENGNLIIVPDGSTPFINAPAPVTTTE